MDERFELRDLGDGKVHLVGIGGAGMSAIATVLLEMGYSVEGSDIKESSYVRRLRDAGAVVGIGHRPENLEGSSVVVRSSAIPDGNPELLEAARLGVPVLSRAQMLSAIMDRRKGIAVAGTHGKTTTTSLLTQVLIACNCDPSFLIGGELNEIGSNARYGTGEYLVAEADESDGSLLHLRPQVAVLTNVDSDHLEYFESLEVTEDVFERFLALLPEDGFAVVCGDDGPARRVGESRRAGGTNVSFYGRSQNSEYRFSVLQVGSGATRIEVFAAGESFGEVTVGIPGIYNTYNAVAALVVADRLGLPMRKAIEGIEGFRGVRRRFEQVGSSRGVTVIDDYAHHPTEVEAVLGLARATAPGRVVAVFQPHRYTRTRLLGEDFGASFADADMVVVTDVYGAGEYPEPGISGKLVADSISSEEPDKKVEYVPDRLELARKTVSLLEPGDTVITLGAGDITHCAREILDVLSQVGVGGEVG